MSVEEKKKLIEADHEKLSIRRQCKLSQLHRSNLYYEPVKVSEESLLIMHCIDEIFTEDTFYGKQKILEGLQWEGFNIGIKDYQGYRDVGRGLGSYFSCMTP